MVAVAFDIGSRKARTAFDDQTVSWRLHDRAWTQVTTDENGVPLRDIQEFLIARVSTRRH